MSDIVERLRAIAEELEKLNALADANHRRLVKRLAAVEALHAQAGNHCAYCVDRWPCLTVCAARGEQK